MFQQTDEPIETYNSRMRIYRQRDGYNRKHLHGFLRVYRNFYYRAFFVTMNFMIGIFPYFILFTKDNRFSISPYFINDILVLISLLDHFFVWIFIGKQDLRRIPIMIEFLSSIGIIGMGWVVSFLNVSGDPKDGNFEAQHNLFFIIYSI